MAGAGGARRKRECLVAAVRPGALGAEGRHVLEHRHVLIQREREEDAKARILEELSSSGEREVGGTRMKRRCVCHTMLPARQGGDLPLRNLQAQLEQVTAMHSSFFTHQHQFRSVFHALTFTPSIFNHPSHAAIIFCICCKHMVDA